MPTKDQLNKAVLAVAGVNREAAMRILARYGTSNTPDLRREQWPAVIADFEAEKARLEARIQGRVSNPPGAPGAAGTSPSAPRAQNPLQATHGDAPGVAPWGAPFCGPRC